MAAEWTCILCAAAGLATLAPRYRRTSICQDHRDGLRASGRGWCERGRHVVPLAIWRKGVCRACDNARRAARYRAHREEERVRNAAYHAANAEYRRSYVQAWKAAHPERRRQHAARTKQQWRAANPERARAAAAAWRARHRQEERDRYRRYAARRKLRILWGGAR